MNNRLHAADVLKSGDFRFLTILWCDNANVIRSNSVHLPTLLGKIPEDGYEARRSDELRTRLERRITKSVVLQSVPALFDVPVVGAGLEPVREINLVPDWGTLVVPAYLERQAYVLGDMTLDSKPWALCPRGLLRRAVKQLENIEYYVMAGAEIEFFLFEEGLYDEGEGGLPEPTDRDVYAQNSASDVVKEAIGSIADALYAMGIGIANYNAEAGPGQHEISLDYSDPMTLADRIIYARETIRSVARDYGLITSFLPKIYETSTGSGCHVHLSLWKYGENVLAEAGRKWSLSGAGESFIAGVMNHLPALMAFTAPTPNSYRRLEPRHWSGAYRIWGFDNREAAVRVPSNPYGDGPTNFEFKTVDMTANPYIALWAVLTAGADGVTHGSVLSDPVERDPANLTYEERKKQGIEPLPRTLDAALSALEKDDVLRDSLGEEYYRVYTAVKRCEFEELKDCDLEKERKLLLTRY